MLGEGVGRGSMLQGERREKWMKEAMESGRTEKTRSRKAGCRNERRHLMSVTADVFHRERSPLNDDADANINLRARAARGTGVRQSGT
jgi:hypothetical protein